MRFPEIPPDRIALGDRVRSEMVKRLRADPIIANIFGSSIGALDWGMRTKAALPRLLVTTLSSKENQIAGGTREDLTVYVVAEFSVTSQDLAEEGERGLASLQGIIRDVFRPDPHLITKIDGVDTQLVTWSEPDEGVLSYNMDQTVGSLIWPWRYRKFR